MECLACNECIDDDSAFCDMCGVELFVCSTCRVPISGKFCTKCGKPSVLASALYAQSDPVAAVSGGSVRPAAAGSVIGCTVTTSGDTKLTAGEAPKGAPVTVLRLRNLNLNLDLKLSESTLIGRTTGPLSASLGGFDQISSKHCLVERDGATDWRVTDLGSTNGTFYNNYRLPVNQPQSLSNGSFLKIANYEFFISID